MCNNNKICLNDGEICEALGIRSGYLSSLENGDDPIPSFSFPGIPGRLYPVDAVSAWVTRQFTKQTSFRPIAGGREKRG